MEHNLKVPKGYIYNPNTLTRHLVEGISPRGLAQRSKFHVCLTIFNWLPENKIFLDNFISHSKEIFTPFEFFLFPFLSSFKIIYFFIHS